MDPEERGVMINMEIILMVNMKDIFLLILLNLFNENYQKLGVVKKIKNQKKVQLKNRKSKKEKHIKREIIK